eukprot:UN06380
MTWQAIKFCKDYECETFVSQIRNRLEIAKFLLPSLPGFTFHKDLIENRFEYKLFCLLENIDERARQKYIEIDNGAFSVNMNCIVSGEKYVISDYPDPRNDIFEFQSLKITNGAKLTVLPFGKPSKNGYLMGYIRIHCHQDMLIDEDCCLDVNGKGYYGDFPAERGHFGRGGFC